MSGALSKLLRDLGKTVAEQQASRRGIDLRLSRAEGKAERASSRLRTLRQDAMQGRSGVARVSLLFGELADEIEQAVEEATERAIEQAAVVMTMLAMTRLDTTLHRTTHCTHYTHHTLHPLPSSRRPPRPASRGPQAWRSCRRRVSGGRRPWVSCGARSRRSSAPRPRPTRARTPSCRPCGSAPPPT